MFCLQKLEEKKEEVGTVMSMCVKDNTLYVGNKERRCSIWKDINKDKSYDIEGHTDPIMKVDLTEDEKFVTIDFGGNVMIWNETTLLKQFNVINKNDTEVSSAIVKGKHVIIGYTNGKISVWNTETLKKLVIMNHHRGKINDFTIVKDRLVSCSSDKTIIVWSKKRYSHKITISLQFEPLCMTSYRDRIVVGQKHKIKIYNKKGLLLNTLSQHIDSINSIMVTTGNMLVSCSDTELTLWNIDDRRCLDVYTNDRFNSIREVNKSKDNKIITGDINGHIILWSIKRIR